MLKFLYSSRLLHGDTSHFAEAVKSAVAEVNRKIEQYHCKVYEIDYKHIASLSQHEFCSDTGSIAEYQEQDERQAHALCTAAAVVLHQIDRP